MRQGPFIDLFSEVFGIEHKSVRVMTRALRDAGLLTTGARGVNAPHMTFQDAASLTVALLSGEPPSRIEEVASRYLGAKLWDVTIAEHADTIMSGLELNDELSAGEFISAVFEVHARNPKDEDIEPYTSSFGGFLPVTIEISESSESLSVLLSPASGGEAHYLFYDFAGFEKFARQFPEPENLGERIQINTIYDEHNEKNKKGMRICRWITRDEITTIARAIAEVE